ncbi:MAG: hypothetical protein AABW47_02955 [Nanoarchaeota archaeon]
MFKEMITFATVSAFPSGVLGELLSKWEAAGFFSYLLPFLLIFALVFGILTRVQLFKENKMVNGIIALSVALMALQFDFVPSFFSQIFPRLGIGLAIILGIMIIVGLFADPKSAAVNYVLLGVGVITMGMILIQSAGAVGWQSGEWWGENWQMIVGAIFLFILVSIIIGGANPKDKDHKTEFFGPWARGFKD